MDFDDEQLVQRCQQELPYVTTAFESLLRRYESLVFRTCRSYLRDDQEAEEACQDALLRVFHGLPKFEGRSAFRTWLFRIVANVCATRWAKLSKRADLAARYREIAEFEVEPDYEPSESELDEVQGAIGEGLDLLAADDREVLIQRHVVGLSLDELAETLGVGQSAAKMRLYRAEKRLRKAYEAVIEKSQE